MHKLAVLALVTSVVSSTSCANDSIPTPLAPLASAPGSVAADREEGDDSEDRLQIAVIGDTPYGQAKLDTFPLLVAKINADPGVRFVAHLGDIKAGKNSDCSNAYFDMIRGLFDGFAVPLLYTPGDNEWTDCHVASKNNGLYTPTERLQAVRARFFPLPGRSLGQRRMRVFSQAFDRENAQYIENSLWMRSHVVFVMVNIPGSNNDGASWGTPLPDDAANYPSQDAERATRARANAAWLARAFGLANRVHAAGLVLMTQADMWDTAEPTLAGYDELVQQIGSLAAAFRRPVLLLEGDSHVFKVDNPFSSTSSLHGLHASTPVAENVTRIVVEGSDKGRTEYLRVTIDPRVKKSPLFSWERVPLQ